MPWLTVNTPVHGVCLPWSCCYSFQHSDWQELAWQESERAVLKCCNLLLQEETESGWQLIMRRIFLWRARRMTWRIGWSPSAGLYGRRLEEVSQWVSMQGSRLHKACRRHLVLSQSQTELEEKNSIFLKKKKKKVEQAHWFNLQCIYQALSCAEGSTEMPELLLLVGMARYHYEGCCRRKWLWKSLWNQLWENQSSSFGHQVEDRPRFSQMLVMRIRQWFCCQRQLRPMTVVQAQGPQQ